MVPPNYNAAITIRHKFRFVAVAGGTSIITTPNVMNLLTFYKGPALTDNFTLISGFRVRKVRMWGFADGISPLSKNSIEFLVSTAGTVGAKPRVYSASSSGPTFPGKIQAVPPKESAAAAWQNSLTATTSTTGFSMVVSYTAGAVLDLHLEFVLNNGDPVMTSTSVGPITPVNVIIAQNLDSTSVPSNFQAVGKFPRN